MKKKRTEEIGPIKKELIEEIIQMKKKEGTKGIGEMMKKGTKEIGEMKKKQKKSNFSRNENYCLNIVASVIDNIRSQTLISYWRTVWPGCVANNKTIQTSSLSDEIIISLAHEIGGEGFDTFSQNDIDELLMDNVLNVQDIIGTTSDIENQKTIAKWKANMISTI
ncbi:hypothetical protein CEXT_121731 [Caerostris extrusa]|uniref:Uncharacterized protein n=1 Tax=Caerostris extrusa TaxID=172846 RepID=A0AAV4N6F4_CAEEX|nr:hypothetical protein CEXT_121731 [Caerostris extrusa]